MMGRDSVRLLVVEDEVLIAMQLRRNLESHGYYVYKPVTNAKAAIDSAEAQKPDVVLMDIRLPGEMDGIDAAREIGTRHNIPVIFVTGYSDPDMVARARAVNPLALLGKPVDVGEIDAAIESA
ncbi:MAG: response regulator [Spirochaetia bacterium]